MSDEFRTNGSYVASLASAVMTGGEALGNVPELLKIVLEEESWRRFVTPRGEIVEHERFVDFATTPPLHGIGADIPLLKRIVEDDPKALTALNKALVGKPGGDRRSPDYRTIVNNVNNETRNSPTGNKAEYALRKLRKDAPGLHARVIRGELTPHAAMIEAGFRKRMISIPVEDAERAARSICANASPEFLDELIEAIERNRTT